MYITIDNPTLAQLAPGHLLGVIVVLLESKITGNPISIEQAMIEAKCYAHLPPTVVLAQIAEKIQELELASGAPQAVFATDTGGQPPTFTPNVSAAICFDTSTGAQWNWYNNRWN